MFCNVWVLKWIRDTISFIVVNAEKVYYMTEQTEVDLIPVASYNFHQ